MNHSTSKAKFTVILLFFLLLQAKSFDLQSQNYVTVYSENYEEIENGTNLNSLGYSSWGGVALASHSDGEGADNSDGFVVTDMSQNMAVVLELDLETGKSYRVSNDVKFKSGANHKPLQVLGVGHDIDYYDPPVVSGTDNWESYSCTFSVLSGAEVVKYQTYRYPKEVLYIDNLKLQIEGVAWLGTESSDWYDPDNWEGGVVPSNLDHVLITNVGFDPVIDSEMVQVASMEVADGAKVLVENGQSLIISGQLTGNTGYVEAVEGASLFADRIVGDAHVYSTPPLFKLNSIFQPHMVLQRDQPIPIYGEAEDGMEITVEFGDQTVSTTASEGQWSVTLNSKPAGGPYSLKATGNRIFEIDDILMGDVWICGGQSNMQGTVSAYQDFPEFENVPGDYENDQLRFLTVQVYESLDPMEEIQVAQDWTQATPASISEFSATGYFFGKYLQTEIGVPVGLIKAARGSTGMGSFMPIAAVEANEFAKDEYNYDDHPLSGPSTLYNSMIHPLTNQPVKGVIWYQGEYEANNGSNQPNFKSIFGSLVESWRAAWEQQDLPFIFTQLSAFGDIADSPSESDWALVRQEQLDAWKELPATGMVVSIDGGVSNNIHPPNKEDVGTRLALMARGIAYDEEPLVYSGPVFENADSKIDNDTVRVFFKHFSEGLESMEVTRDVHGAEPYQLLGDSLYGFELAGSDEIYYASSAMILNDSTISLFSNEVADPQYVRFGWASFPLTNFYNSENLLASPFQAVIDQVEPTPEIKLGVGENGGVFQVLPTLLSRGEWVQVLNPKGLSFEVELIDISGSQLQKFTSNGDAEILIPIAKQYNGLYILNIQSDSHRERRKIIVR